MTLNERIIFLQVDMMDYLMQRWGTNTDAFLALDEKYKILRFLRIGYEPFHLTGDEGIAEEVENYISEQGGVI